MLANEPVVLTSSEFFFFMYLPNIERKQAAENTIENFLEHKVIVKVDFPTHSLAISNLTRRKLLICWIVNVNLLNFIAQMSHCVTY